MMEAYPMLWLMVGPPASGKTTACSKLFEPETVHVSRDAIRFAKLKDGEDYFAHEDEVLKEFYNTISKALNEGLPVVADATHLTEKARRATIDNLKLDPHVEISVGAVVARVPLEVSLERNAKRTGRAYVPESAIKNMYNSYKDPYYDESIDYSFILYIDKDQEQIEMKQFLGR